MYSLNAIPTGTIYCSAITRIARIGIGQDIGRVEPLPCYVWLLRNMDSGACILVDAGLPDTQSDVAPEQDRFVRTKDEQLLPALRRHGIGPDDLRCCILTHLHWDNAWGARRLGKTPLLLQRNEIRYAIAPYTLDRHCYDLNNDDVPFYTPMYWNMRFLDGDTRLDDDLSIVALPGHTPGSQGVLVNTPTGRIFLAGDIACTRENLETGLPSGIRMDSRDAIQAMDRLEQMQKDGVTVIPSHDATAAQPFLLN